MLQLVQVATVLAKLASDGTTISSGGAAEAELTRLINQVSGIANRLVAGSVGLLKAERTEDYGLREGQRVVWLRAWPVDLTATVDVRIDSDRAFGLGDVVDPADYTIVDRYGALEFDTWYWPTVVYGENILRVKYTAGLAATAAALETAYPDLAMAIADQVIHHWRRRGNKGGQAQQAGAGSNTYAGGVDWLPQSLEVVLSFQRKHTG